MPVPLNASYYSEVTSTVSGLTGSCSDGAEGSLPLGCHALALAGAYVDPHLCPVDVGREMAQSEARDPQTHVGLCPNR
jgi:hypothetical protein